MALEKSNTLSRSYTRFQIPWQRDAQEFRSLPHAVIMTFASLKQRSRKGAGLLRRAHGRRLLLGFDLKLLQARDVQAHLAELVHGRLRHLEKHGERVSSFSGN